MKNTKHIFIILIGFVIAYLLGSFIEISFNITKWDKGTRFLVSFLGLIMFVFSFCIEFKNSKKYK